MDNPRQTEYEGALTPSTYKRVGVRFSFPPPSIYKRAGSHLV